MIGRFATAVIGAFRSSLFRWVVLSAVLFLAAFLLCFLIVGIHASGISIPLSLLMSYVNRLFDPVFVQLWLMIKKLPKKTSQLHTT